MRDSCLWVQRALTLTGVVCLGWFGFVTADAAIYQREQAAEFERLRAAQALPAPLIEISDVPADADTHLIGMLDIPRLSVSTPVVRGDDDATLRLAAGHLPDTPRPWERGNSAIAGHRDGLFRPLKDIRVGDDVFVRTTHGDLRYRVRNTKIVMPDDLSVLEPAAGYTLTLITCYPFYHVGSAPKRFVVHADRVESVAESSLQAVRGESRVDARKASAEDRKPRKSPSKASAERRKSSNSLSKTSAERRKTRNALSKASADPGKAQKFFRKIGAFFKGSKPPPR